MKKISQAYFGFIICCLVSFPQLHAQTTRFESSNGLETDDYFSCISFYKKLQQANPSKIAIKTMGLTDAGYPLHLVLLGTGGKNFSKASTQNKAIILLNNGIHPGEPDGIDASMLLAKAFVNEPYQLPNNIVLAIIPIYNIGGALNRNNSTRVNQNGPIEYGFRGNAQNLDLNRDFIKCDSRNAKSFAEIFHLLNPDIFIDTHVSDGADYQHTMTLLTTQYDKLVEPLGSLLRNKLEPQIYKEMKLKNYDLFPYADFEDADFSKGLQMFYDAPRYSSGYASLFNTIGFMPETHMLKPYKQRVEATLQLLKTIINIASNNSKEIKAARKAAIEHTAQAKSLKLDFAVDSSKLTKMTFLGYERDTAISEATGLKQMFYNRLKPFEMKLPYYNFFAARDSFTLPQAYIIPQGWHQVVDLLKLNKVQVQQLKKDTIISINYYSIVQYQAQAKPYEKHHKNQNVVISKFADSQLFLKGDYMVWMNQAANKFITQVLEPTAEDSYFSWNFFDAVLQQKEWYSDYRFDTIAANLLKQNPTLRSELEDKKKADPAFANDASAILAFIYKKSPWYEKAHLRYPVYRLEE